MITEACRTFPHRSLIHVLAVLAGDWHVTSSTVATAALPQLIKWRGSAGRCRLL